MYTTLNKIRKDRGDKGWWEKLLKYLGKTSPDDESLSLLTILDAVGFGHTLWCFRAVEGFKKEKQLLAITYAREVEHLMPAESKKSLDVFERYANGLATQEEFDAARWAAARAVTAAYAAARSATHTARAAADAAADAAYVAEAAARGAWEAADVAAYLVAQTSEAAACDTYSNILGKQENQLRQLLEKSCTNVTTENSKH